MGEVQRVQNACFGTCLIREGEMVDFHRDYFSESLWDLAQLEKLETL